MRSEAPPSSAMSRWRCPGLPLLLVATTVRPLSRASAMIVEADRLRQRDQPFGGPASLADSVR